MKIFILFFFLAISHLGHAQTESSAKKSEISSVIKKLIDEKYKGHRSVKYYKEILRDSLYYEAVFRHNKDEYSLLFDTLGNVYETEVTVPYSEIETSIRKKIEEKLNKDFPSFKIKKSQEVILKSKLMYEFLIKGKQDKRVSFREYYFDRQGNFLKDEVVELESIQTLF